MYYEQLQANKEYSIQGNIYKISSVLSYGFGLLRGCHFYILSPVNKELPDMCGMRWADGHIDRLKRYISS